MEKRSTIKANQNRKEVEKQRTQEGNKEMRERERTQERKCSGYARAPGEPFRTWCATLVTF